MQHLLDIKSLSLEDIQSLLQRAYQLKHEKVALPDYGRYSLAPLFYENSTRTRLSFAMAAHHLHINFLNFEMHSSSESKGEELTDTLHNLLAMGIEIFVIRHKEDEILNQLAATLPSHAHLINAGAGVHAHPSQALLDIMTIAENKPDLSQLKVAIVGDVRHSRVANSFFSLCNKLGLNQVAVIAPPIWQPLTLPTGFVAASFEEGIRDADVVMCLRVQHERLNANENFDLNTYKRDFMLNPERFKLAKPDALLMHPGPVNRGIEIDSLLLDVPQSKILEQVRNGVFMRMAILEALIQ